MSQCLVAWPKRNSWSSSSSYKQHVNWFYFNKNIHINTIANLWVYDNFDTIFIQISFLFCRTRDNFFLILFYYFFLLFTPCRGWGMSSEIIESHVLDWFFCFFASYCSMISKICLLDWKVGFLLLFCIFCVIFDYFVSYFTSWLQWTIFCFFFSIFLNFLLHFYFFFASLPHFELFCFILASLHHYLLLFVYFI